ncbi:hypothetical protein Tco_1538035 [Tanacetum coccineum]
MGTQKKSVVTNGKGLVYSGSSSNTQEEQFADEKVRKARTLTVNGCSKRSSQTSDHGLELTAGMRKLNHALMAFTVNNEVSMCSKLCLDSYNALQLSMMNCIEFGDQDAALMPIS